MCHAFGYKVSLTPLLPHSINNTILCQGHPKTEDPRPMQRGSKTSDGKMIRGVLLSQF